MRLNFSSPIDTMQKILVISLALTVSAMSAASSYTPAQVRAAIKQAGTPERFLAAISTNTAKTSGQMIDAQTQLIGSAATGMSLVYYVRYINREKKDYPDLLATRRSVASLVSPSVCTAPVSSILIKEYGAEYKYMIYSASREYLFEYSLNKESCEQGYRW